MIDEQLIVRKKTAKAVSQLKESLTMTVQDFQRSPESTVRWGPAVVKIAPDSRKVEKSFSLRSQKPSGIIYVPRPLCLVDGTPDPISSHAFSAKVWELDGEAGNLRFEWKGARTYGSLHLTRLGGSRWSLRYTFANPGHFKLVSGSEAKLTAPSELNLEPCKGTEDEEIVRGLRESLD